MADIIGHLDYHIVQLKIFLPFVIYCVVSEQRSKDVAGNCTGGIAVTFVIDCSDDASGEVILMSERAVYSDCKCLLSYPAFTEPVYVIKIAVPVLRQFYCLIDQINELLKVLISLENGLCSSLGFRNDLFERHLLFGEYDPVDDMCQYCRRHVSK